jgi:hypothetical protein
MDVSAEIALLRKRAADLIEQAARRDTPLSPEEDAEIMSLLRRARELEAGERRKDKRLLEDS